jgi:hypothetical protein
VIENVDIARDISSTWYLTQQVSIVTGGKIGYTTREQEGVFCERIDRKLKSVRNVDVSIG